MKTEERVRSKTDLERNFVFMTTKPANPTYPFYNPSEMIPSVCEVYDEKLERNRTAVYRIGERSIWVDEIKHFENKDKIEGSPIFLINGVKTVNIKEKNLLDFLNVSGNNEKNDDTRLNSTVLYRRVDFEKVASDDFEKAKKADSARHYVNNAPIREVRSYLLALQKTTEDYKRVQELSEYEVRLSLRPLAGRSPETFLESLKDNYLQNKAKIIQAIYEDVIVFNEKENTLSWKNGGVIIKAPTDISAPEHFSTLSIDSDKYMKAFNEVIEALKAVNKDAPSEIGDIADTDPLETLITECIDKGVMTCSVTGIWFKYNTDGGEEKKWKTRADLKKELSNDKELVQELFRKTS